MFREGIININKPADWTSQDVCAKLRGRLHIKRIGHTGTLDPMATGVLPVCIGRATRIIEYYDLDSKTYIAAMKLGIKTDTLDIGGEVLENASFDSISEDDIINCVNSFVGEIEQIPPKYSAVRINGKRAYDLAREGKDFEIKPRIVKIESINILSIDLNSGIIKIEVTCSKGTYIRTLCDDIGDKLGCYATMTELTRTKNGCFDISDSMDINEIVDLSDNEINDRIISVENTLEKLGSIEINDNRIIAYKNGNEISANDCKIITDTQYNNIYKAFANTEFMGTAKLENNTIKPEKVIIFGDN